MDGSYQQIGELIGRVRARWRRLVLFRASVRAALSCAAVLIAALAAARFTGRSPNALAAVGAVGALAALASIVRALWPVRQLPSDKQVARFIEEREPSLDDRLVSAVDVASLNGSAGAPALSAMVLADANRRAAAVAPSTIIAGEVLRRAGFQAAGALVLLGLVAFLGRGTVRQSADALRLALFPSLVTLEVKPGNARLQVGTPLVIEARLVGNQAPVAAQLQRAANESDVDGWIAVDMPQDESGVFRASLDSVAESFKYRVVAGGFTSPSFDITVARPPRITRIDLEYKYPSGLGLEPRKEEDSGDIYAPAGTNVRLLVHTDRAVASGEMALGAGQSVGLSPSRTSQAASDDGTLLEASLTVERDDSYRVRIADRDGLSAPGETEYFIRMLDDRPPEVRVLKPARDRNVTRLEEVDIEAEAQDDFGIERLDLVYSVRGGKDQIVPLDIPKRAATVNGAHTLYLEDLNVRPGDFVSYYVRARDLARGRRSSEARSDIFFLEVKPFEQEFSLAQSQAMGAGGGSPQLDDLVSAQKEIIVATWKLDRRAAAASGAKSDQDIKSVGRAEAELKTRVEETSSSFRESSMRNPRRRQPTPGAPRAGQTTPEEDAMTAAALAMGKAVGSLQALKTKEALPSELEALNHLLKAQGQVKERQITRQTGSGPGGSNRSTQDLSSLFDKELQRHQQTNYETPTSTEQKGDSESSLLDKIRELAQRQDELLRQQQELARRREKLSAEELKRALESLTREQSALRQRAEEMAREMSRQGEPSDSKQKDQQGSESQAGQRNQAGQQSGGEKGQSGKPSQSGQSRDGQQTSTSGGDNGNRMRDVSEEMRSAASELRREDPTQATERANRALQKLRELEQQLRAGAPDERRRAMGDLQLEARQLADGQRQVSSELGRVSQGDNGRDAVRRLAGEQERLADRLERLQKNLDRQAGAPSQPGRTGAENGANAQRAAVDASREIERQRLGERMRQSAGQMRAAAGAGAPGVKDQPGQPGATRPSSDSPALRETSGAQQEIARSLDRLADKLGAAAGSGDDESKKLTGQMAKAQELRERIEEIGKKLEQLGQGAGGREGSRGQQDQQGQQGSKEGQGQPSGQSGAKPGEQPGGQQGGQSQTGQSQSGQTSGDQASSQTGAQSAQGSTPGAGPGGEVARLRDEYSRQLRETRDLLDQLRRDDQTFGHGGAGLTFEGQGMTLSAPGTEAFKQDFAKWEQLRKQATQALELAESSIAKKLQSKEARDRLASGVDDRPPAEYTQQVDSYFKALAGKKSR